MGLRIATFSGKDPMSIIGGELSKHPDIDEVENIWGATWKRKFECIKEHDILIGGGWLSYEPGGLNYDANSPRCRFMITLAESGKWVIWDQRPTAQIWPFAKENALVYFKKCWEKPEMPEGIHLLTWPILELAEKIPADIYDKGRGRDIDIGYYFGWSREQCLTGTRKYVMNRIKNFDWPRETFIETSYTLGTVYQGHQFYGLDPMVGNSMNWWLVYIHFLRRTKVLFAVAGFARLFQGDRRTAEALASGALVFADKPMIQMPNPFEHGKHLFFFDSTDKDSVTEALEMAQEFIKPEKTEEREAIARDGLEHALKYHTAKVYIDYMVGTIKRALGHSNT